MFTQEYKSTKMLQEHEKLLRYGARKTPEDQFCFLNSKVLQGVALHFAQRASNEKLFGCRVVQKSGTKGVKSMTEPVL